MFLQVESAAFSVPWLHILNFIIYALAMIGISYLYVIKSWEWQKILPWGMVTISWLVFFLFLLVRDLVIAVSPDRNFLVGTPTVLATTLSSSIIALTGLTILGMSFLQIKEQKIKTNLPIKQNGELEKERRELVKKLLVAANGDSGFLNERK